MEPPQARRIAPAIHTADPLRYKLTPPPPHPQSLPHLPERLKQGVWYLDYISQSRMVFPLFYGWGKTWAAHGYALGLLLTPRSLLVMLRGPCTVLGLH